MAPGALERVEVLVGDVVGSQCGLDRHDEQRLREAGVGEFWHLAATTEFDVAQADSILRINIEGTGRAFALAEQIGANRFIHTSTAYCCGQIAGDIGETIHPIDAPFTNVYERSKCLSEHLLAAATRTKRGIDWRILRPSVVVGPVETHAAEGVNHGLYGFLRGVYSMREGLRQTGRSVRLSADPSSEINIIPVDHAVRMMAELRESEFPGGPIHHITSDASPTLAETLNAVCDAASVPRFTLVPTRLEAPTAFERVLEQGTSTYGGYLFGGVKRFARAFGKPYSVDAAEVQRFCSRWVEERQARRGAGTYSSKPLETSDVNA